MGRPRIPEARVTATCPVCGNAFTYKRSTPKKMCSRACYLTTLPKRLETTCPICGKVFTYRPSWPRKHCSNVCAGKATIGNIAHFTPNRYTATCEQCGKAFETTPKATRGRFCSRTCHGAWLHEHMSRGEDHFNWRGGHPPYYGASWTKARRQARARDRVCVDCGISPEGLGRVLDVHHLVAFRTFGLERHREANDLANLVALCPACHTRREWADNRSA